MNTNASIITNIVNWLNFPGKIQGFSEWIFKNIKSCIILFSKQHLKHYGKEKLKIRNGKR